MRVDHRHALQAGGLRDKADGRIDMPGRSDIVGYFITRYRFVGYGLECDAGFRYRRLMSPLISMEDQHMDVSGNCGGIDTVHNDNFKGHYNDAQQISEHLPGNCLKP